MGKVHACPHEYPDVEKNLWKHNFQGQAHNNQLDSDDTQWSDFSS